MNRFLMLAGLGVAATAVLLTAAPPQKAHAANPANFSAGRIIDDQIFFDPAGLSQSEIQNFLNAKVPTCDTNGNQMYGSTGLTRKQYAATKGYSTPFTCLKDYVTQTVSKPADAYCNGYPQVQKTAAEIIYGVSQSCGINPRVLIVLLQKEQGLVTDDWPWTIQYRSATGYGCPDTAACDSQYYGFFNQVYSAARQFKYYAQNASSFNYLSGRNNFIQWNPNASCGGSTVFIENKATAGLYNYTPYRPNQAALNAGYGTGDSCSSYGNRNFWLYYNDWFGSTFAPNYWWTYVSQNVYTDSSKTQPADTAGVIAGSRVYATVTIRNAGVATWYKNQVNLGTSNPRDRKGFFIDWSWINYNRAATIKEDSVAPGQTATFEFWMNAPEQEGYYQEFFTPLAENITWMNDYGMYFGINVVPRTYTWQAYQQKTFTDSSMNTPADPTFAVAGGRQFLQVKVLNSGNMTWYKNQVNLGTSGPRDRQSTFYDPTWPSKNRAATIQENSVAPGQVGTFQFWANVPTKPGYYKEYFTPLAEGITWMNDYGMYWGFAVNAPYSWTPAAPNRLFTDQNKTTTVDNLNIPHNTRAYLQIKVKNIGSATWQRGMANLGTTVPFDRQSKFYDSAWPSQNRAAYLVENSVAPGQVGTFELWVNTPTTPGTYKEYFNPVADGVGWMNDYGMNELFIVK